MKSKFKIEWSDAVAPNFSMSEEALILIIEWMFKTGWSYYEDRGVFELLHGLSSIHSQHYPYDHGVPINDMNKMRSYINRAVLNNLYSDSCPAKWRKDYHIEIGKSSIITANNDTDKSKWHGKNFGIYGVKLHDKIDEICQFVGKKLNFSPNDHHPKADVICSIVFPCSQNGMECWIYYSYPNDTSSWHLPEIFKGDMLVADWIDKIHQQLIYYTK